MSRKTIVKYSEIIYYNYLMSLLLQQENKDNLHGLDT